MSKSKFWKILTITLSLCLILGAVIGITASASDEDGVITFDEDSYADYLTIITNSNFAQDNTWSVVDVDGDKKLLINKHGVDTSGTSWNGGVTFRVNKTYTAEHANLAVFEFDMNIDSATAYDNQFILGHQGQFSNNATPFLFSVSLKNLEKQKEHHIVLTYKVTATDENGVPVAYEATYSADGSEPYVVNKIHGKYLTANGGTYELPRVDQVDCMAFALNNSFYGDVYFDNFSLKLVHEHEYSFGVCECGAEKEGFSPIEIYSKNVEYGSKTYLYYAVPVAQVPEADRTADGVWLEVADELGGEIVYKSYPQAETVNIDGTECYVFISRGVPAKELNTKEYVRVMSASGGESRVEAYSAEDYLYQKLYNEAYAAKTAEDVGADGKDYLRRTLYYDLLKYGAIAQELLAPDAADKIGDTSYAAPNDSIQASLGKLDPGTRVVLRFDPTSTDLIFEAWEYVHYDAFGELISSGYATDNAIFDLEGYLYAVPVLDDTPRNEHNFEGEVTFTSNTAGTTHTYYDGKFWVNTNKSGDNYVATQVVENGKLVINKTYTGQNAGFYTKTTNANSAANVAIYEADVKFMPNGSTLEVYFGMGPAGAGDSNRAFYCYFASSGKTEGSPITLKYIYHYSASGSSNRVPTDVSKDMGVTIGEEFKLRVEYHENGRTIGEAFTRFFVNGVLIYETNIIAGYSFHNGTYSQAPDANGVTEVGFWTGYSTKGTLYIDNVSLIQREITFDAENVVPDDRYITDWNTVTSSTTVTQDAYFNDTNFITTEYDPVTGDACLKIDKNKIDDRYNSAGTALLTSSGVTLRQYVTRTEENANTAVFSMDLLMTDRNKMASQIQLYHGSKTNSKDSPFLFQIPSNRYDEHLHIEIIYRATKVDGDGNVIEFESLFTINGKIYDQKSGTKDDAYGANIKSGATALPKVSEVKGLAWAFNNGYLGEAYLDNISMQLLNIAGNDPTVETAE